MEHIVVFSAKDLFDLIHGKPVVDEKTKTTCMSKDCFEKYLKE